MPELLFWTFQGKECTNYKGTSNCKANCKLLWLQYHYRKENCESNEDKEDSRGKEETKIHKGLPRRDTACGGVKAAR